MNEADLRLERGSLTGRVWDDIGSDFQKCMTVSGARNPQKTAVFMFFRGHLHSRQTLDFGLRIFKDWAKGGKKHAKAALFPESPKKS